MIREKVIDPETGEKLEVDLTRALVKDLQALNEQMCSHPETKLCRSTMSDGREEIRKQCLECGELIGTAIAKKDAPQLLKPVDAGFRDERRKVKADERAKIYCKHARLQKDEQDRFSEKYNAHLKSSLWRAKRNKILNRAGGLCEGCREQAATQVHHLTYENLGNEFLFELVAICDGCHTRYHKKDLVNLEKCSACRWGPPGEKNGLEWCSVLEMPVDQAQQGDDPCSRVKEPLK